ncbi:lipase 1 [Dendroctonus ponderosae]|uniref:Lipase n=1 Tax=Dendroctonus ponderosae TaxID=77166 RepID=U4U4M1_DENPD|nr:lipase 1 [Dendroctonus ponderosae]ERL88012.1 hypothetical protein D910_05401 [Dendroctonus ponderosae]KAH1026496.1 hypothetical protein HUJ05_000159 [Dendroctonus ponderosae]
MNKYICVVLVLAVICVKEWKFFVPERFYASHLGEISDFLDSHGYPLESHEVQTEDGYLLTVHRIPNGRHHVQKSTPKPPVFLMHGLLLSSVDWMILGPEKSLALILADAGYDVWIGNNRGNSRSKNHITLHPQKDRKEFFSYSYHEIGIFDLPAMIDHVLSYTGRSKLSYIGYSEGVTSFFVMGAEKPEYNEKILLMNAFAPVTDSFNVTSEIFNVLSAYPWLLKLANFIGWYEMFDVSTAPIFRLLCQSRTLCNLLYHLLGSSKEQMPDQDTQLRILSHLPAGLSLNQISHYIQGTITGIYGPLSQDITTKTDHLIYDVSKVDAPIILYYGESDNLVNQHRMLETVAKKLPNLVKLYKVPYANFNHLDFLYGNNVSLLNEEALRNLNEFNGRNVIN